MRRQLIGSLCYHVRGHLDGVVDERERLAVGRVYFGHLQLGIIEIVEQGLDAKCVELVVLETERGQQLHELRALAGMRQLVGQLE